MRSSSLLSLPAVLALGAAAHGVPWLSMQPQCWQECFHTTDGACETASCICETSADDASYLSNVVQCAVAECDADPWSLQSTLTSLELCCMLLDNPIPSDVIADAYAAVSASPSETSRRPASPTSSRESEHESTWTKTTTDSSGNTVQVVVPVVIGPSGVSTGVMSTSTLGGEATPTNAPSVASRSPTASAAPAPSAPTPALPSTAAAGSEETESPARGNGSPFENMQADASQWIVSCPLLGLVLLALILGGF